MEKLRIKQPKARQVVVWEHEVNALEKYFIEQGRPSLALGVRMAFDTGQREDDIIRFPWSRWVNKSVIVKQQKTGAIVRVDALPELVKAVDRSKRAVEKAKIKSTLVLVNEETGRPWNHDNFSHRVNDGFRELGLKDQETGQPKVFRDLRRSAVVRLALAGCSTIEIGSVTGHSYARIDQILEIYMPRLTGVAKQAIRRILDQRKKKGA